MASFRERISNGGQRSWQVQVRRKGASALNATFSTKRAAERWASIQEGEIAAAKHLPHLEAERHTVNELLNRWVPEIAPKRRKNISAQVRWWREQIGERKLSEVTPALLRNQRDRLIAERFTRAVPRKEKPVAGTKRRRLDAPTHARSRATVNRYMACIGRALSVAHREYEWMHDNPARRIADLKESQGRVRFLSEEERGELLKACRAQSEDLYDFTLTALSTGARAGELLELRWSDVDLAKKRATLQATKNGERRALSLAGGALAAFEKRSKVRRIDNDRVWPGHRSKPFDYAKAFRAAVKAAGISNFRFHDCRHSAASYLAMNGASTAELAAVLGHRTLQMVKRYAHLSDQHVAGVVERMNDKFLGQVGA